MPIRFDDAAADQLVHQLVTTSTSVAEVIATVQQVLPTTTANWFGRFRYQFDLETLDQVSALGDLVVQLNLIAVAVTSLQLEAAAARLLEAQQLAASAEALGQPSQPDPAGLTSLDPGD